MTEKGPVSMLQSVGKVAKAFQISPSLLRYAERQGLIPPPERIDGDGRRVYGAAHLDAIRAWREHATGRSAMDNAK